MEVANRKVQTFEITASKEDQTDKDRESRLVELYDKKLGRQKQELQRIHKGILETQLEEQGAGLRSQNR